MKHLIKRIAALEIGGGPGASRGVDLTRLSREEVARVEALSAALRSGRLSPRTMTTSDLRFVVSLPFIEGIAA